MEAILRLLERYYNSLLKTTTQQQDYEQSSTLVCVAWKQGSWIRLVPYVQGVCFNMNLFFIVHAMTNTIQR